MKLFYYLDVVPNFGDELNPWLFSRLIPELLDDDESELLLGVGSILYNNHPASAVKIVLGSGFGGYTEPPIVGPKWKIYFVRGPRSAQALGLDANVGIGDGATLLRLLPPDTLPKASASIGVSFMPHWESALDGTWHRVAAEAGMSYIDPRWDVERVMGAIRSSSLVVTEAMHGAIVADALRVPWIPFEPLLKKHRFKWYDWAESVSVPFAFQQSSPSSWNEWVVQRLRDRKALKPSKSLSSVAAGPDAAVHAAGSRPTLSKARSYAMKTSNLGGRFARASAVAALKRAARTEPLLSTDAAIDRVTARMAEQLAAFRSDFRK